ncbi:hypothetical protein HK099_008154 [Clydaea vesicula]|uniref:WD repeat domain phosphoinositide-interacting protein 2 n=1 Tax=Clydaea vesicula TaxID=447962 RepID=A0AAD5U0F7_9FUNG|nr:hypothetical protein HK099_008154 [Clydaea vesicula]
MNVCFNESTTHFVAAASTGLANEATFTNLFSNPGYQIYNSSSLSAVQKMLKIETSKNLTGLSSMNKILHQRINSGTQFETFLAKEQRQKEVFKRNRLILVLPALQVGQVKILKFCNKFNADKNVVEVDIERQPESSIIIAHKSKLRCLTLNDNGDILATASEIGTIIRVFCTKSGTLLNEFRRGYDCCFIHCLSFNKDSQWILCSSDKETIHVFEMKEKENSAALNYKNNNNPPNTTLKNNEGLLKQFKSTLKQSNNTSFAKFKVKSKQHLVSVCSFYDKNLNTNINPLDIDKELKRKLHFLIIYSDGACYQCSFDKTSKVTNNSCHLDVFKFLNKDLGLSNSWGSKNNYLLDQEIDFQMFNNKNSTANTVPSGEAVNDFENVAPDNGILDDNIAVDMYDEN